MTTIAHLKTAGGAGAPDSVLAIRIDVIAAALKWAHTLMHVTDSVESRFEHDMKEEELYRTILRYKYALRNRPK